MKNAVPVMECSGVDYFEQEQQSKTDEHVHDDADAKVNKRRNVGRSQEALEVTTGIWGWQGIPNQTTSVVISNNIRTLVTCCWSLGILAWSYQWRHRKPNSLQSSHRFQKGKNLVKVCAWLHKIMWPSVEGSVFVIFPLQVEKFTILSWP